MVLSVTKSNKARKENGEIEWSSGAIQHQVSTKILLRCYLRKDCMEIKGGSHVDIQRASNNMPHL